MAGYRSLQAFAGSAMILVAAATGCSSRDDGGTPKPPPPGGSAMGGPSAPGGPAPLPAAPADGASAGAEFLAKNKTAEGVKVTPSGLQYQVITEGKGAQPTAADSVTVNYKGTLIDGTVFDSSYSRNEPTTFPLNGVIPGWTEGLQLMKVGGKSKFFVPANLAYGAQSPTPTIPPNSVLVFEIELLSINAAK